MSLRLLLYVIDVFKTSFVRYGCLKDVSEMACVCSINDCVFTKPQSETLKIYYWFCLFEALSYLLEILWLQFIRYRKYSNDIMYILKDVVNILIYCLEYTTIKNGNNVIVEVCFIFHIKEFILPLHSTYSTASIEIPEGRVKSWFYHISKEGINETNSGNFRRREGVDN